MAAFQRGLLKYRCNNCFSVSRENYNRVNLLNAVRSLSISTPDQIKRKWISKWKNRFSDQVYSEGKYDNKFYFISMTM